MSRTEFFTEENTGLTLRGKQDFMGKEIPVVLGGFGENKKCLADKTIAEIHNQPVFEIRRRIGDNIKRFTQNVDFIDLKQRMGESHTSEFLLKLGYAKQSITQAEHIYILSERGYAKLIKIMDTDLAWDIHDKLIDEYFELRDGNSGKTQAEIILEQAQALVAQERRMMKLEDASKKHEQRMNEIEAKMTTHSNEYYTIAGYASLKNKRIDVTQANLLGRKAVKLSKEYGYDIDKINDPRFGTVNAYHIDILEMAFRNK